jgi:hypothetical protein
VISERRVSSRFKSLDTNAGGRILLVVGEIPLDAILDGECSVACQVVSALKSTRLYEVEVSAISKDMAMALRYLARR